jgi:hypothetical protein
MSTNILVDLMQCVHFSEVDPPCEVTGLRYCQDLRAHNGCNWQTSSFHSELGMIYQRAHALS